MVVFSGASSVRNTVVTELMRDHVRDGRVSRAFKVPQVDFNVPACVSAQGRPPFNFIIKPKGKVLERILIADRGLDFYQETKGSFHKWEYVGGDS